jgi:drug/metabolite transporter (DMT)-like permease
MSKHSHLFVAVVLFLVAAIWGVNPAVMKIGLLSLPPMPYNAARMIIATMVAWTALALSGSYRQFERRDLIALLKVSVFGFFLFQLFFTVGVQKTSSGNSSFMLSLLPVTVVILNRIYKIEAITRPVVAGISLSVTGIVLLILGSGKELSLSGPHLSGILLILVAQAGYGYYTVFTRNLLERYSVYQVTASLITVSTVLFLAVSAPSVAAVSWKTIPAAAWISVAYSGIFALCIGNFLWIWGTGIMGSTRASVFNNLSPVFAVATGYVLLGETFGPVQVAGAAVIFAGLWITRNRQKLCGEGQTCKE